MLLVIHGENIQAMHAELERFRQTAKGKEIRRMDGKTAKDAEITQALESTSLFGGDIVVIIEHLFAQLGRKGKEIKAKAQQIIQAAEALDVIIWEERILSKTVLDALGSQAVVKDFPLPVVLFQFLDSIKPQSAPTLIPLYERARSYDAAELLFFMIVKRIRQLIQIKEHISPEGMQAWQMKRLETQAFAFSVPQLLIAHRALLMMDNSIKSGTSAFALSDLLAQWLIHL